MESTCNPVDPNNLASSLLIYKPNPTPLGLKIIFSLSHTFEKSENNNYKFSFLIPIPVSDTDTNIWVGISKYYSQLIKIYPFGGVYLTALLNKLIRIYLILFLSLYKN